MLKNTYIICLFCLFCNQVLSQDRITGHNFATRSEVIAQKGMVATSQPLATQVGLDILKKGGSAIDAAIAINATLGLMEPTGCGIGGDLFAIVWDAKTQKLYGLNGSGRSPKSLTLAYFKEKGLKSIPSFGALSVSVPGAVDAWFELHQKFGKMKMSEILQPAIDYAENGFPVSELVAYYLQASFNRFQNNPNFKETYTINGNALEKGDIFKNKALANTYKKIANEGKKAFYKGEIAKAIELAISNQGGFLNREDLASHYSEWIEPVSTNYRGYDVWELPPNGQGATVLQMLNILEGYEFKPEDFGTARHIHLFAETKKVVFEDRAKYYADPFFAKIPLNELISKEYAKKRRSLISPNRASYNFKAGDNFAKETVYFCVADKDGNMVSFIQSNYRGMGSGIIPEGLGFMLQNRGELFSLEEGHNNLYAPAKRPFHTIIPAFVTKNKQPFMAFGVMGGDFQPLGHTQILMNIIDFGMNVQEAGDAPRIDHLGSSDPVTGAQERDNKGGTITLESGFEYETIRKLMQMGHKVGYGYGGYGGYQAIKFDAQKKIYYGASESRKDGQASGY